HKQLSVNASSKTTDIDNTINEFFSGGIGKGVSDLIKIGVHSLLGDTSIGESESDDMIIIWHDNALLRCDAYYWKYSFSSKGIVDVAENIFMVYCVKKVINTSKVDSDVLIYAISKMYLDKNPGDNDGALAYVKHILDKIH
ncbi:hypothetical protein, partial [Salmonella sp. s51228]|uniref:hypothetical protein n=1 Tax=Salmonella sp. s51228 TaxID=3159652 RepID=UPI00397EDF58